MNLGSTQALTEMSTRNINSWNSELGHYATSRKVAGSIPDYCIFLMTYFRPQYGPGFDSATNRNEYQDYFLGSKGSQCVGLKILLPSCAHCLKILASSTYCSPKSLFRPVQETLYLYLHKLLGSQTSVVSIATRLRGWTVPSWNPGRDKRLVSSTKAPDPLWTPFSLQFNDVQQYSEAINWLRNDAAHSPSSAAEDKHKWSHTFTPPMCLDRLHKEKFSLNK